MASSFTVQMDFAQFRRDCVAGAQPFLLKLLDDVRVEIRRRMDLPKSGRKGPFRRRSALGEAPARQTGKLYNDMPIIDVSLAPHLDINTQYAIHLEPPAALDRPFAQVAVDDVRQRFATVGL